MNADDFSRSEVGMMLTGAVAAALAVWRAFFNVKRGVRTDRVEEAEAHAREGLIASLQSTIKAQDERITTLTMRVDAIAKERTDAQVAAAKLETQVMHLTSTISELNKEIARLHGLLDLANDTIKTLQGRLLSP